MIKWFKDLVATWKVARKIRFIEPGLFQPDDPELIVTFKLACAIRSISPELHERVAELVAHYNHKKYLDQTSGEWRRHQVYAQLLKEFPDVKPSHIALAIEVEKCCG